MTYFDFLPRDVNQIIDRFVNGFRLNYELPLIKLTKIDIEPNVRHVLAYKSFYVCVYLREIVVRKLSGLVYSRLKFDHNISQVQLSPRAPLFCVYVHDLMHCCNEDGLVEILRCKFLTTQLCCSCFDWCVCKAKNRIVVYKNATKVAQVISPEPILDCAIDMEGNVIFLNDRQQLWLHCVPEANDNFKMLREFHGYTLQGVLIDENGTIVCYNKNSLIKTNTDN